MSVKKGEKLNVWLVCGDDPVLIAEKKRELLTRYFKGNPPGPTVFDGTGSFEAYRAALGGQSLFAAETAVVIENPAFLKRTLPERDEKAFDRFLTALREAPPDIFVVLTLDGKPDKRLKAVKPFAGNAQQFSLYECTLMKADDAAQWMERALYDRGKSMDGPARAYLTDVLGAWTEISQAFLETECDKIFLMCEGKTVTKKLLEDALPDYMDQGVFRFLDRLLARDAEAVAEAVPRVFTDTQTTLKNLGALAASFRRIKMWKELSGAPMSPKEKMERLGVKGTWQLRNLERDAKKVTETEAEDFLLSLYRFQAGARMEGGGGEIGDALLRFCLRGRKR